MGLNLVELFGIHLKTQQKIGEYVAQQEEHPSYPQQEPKEDSSEPFDYSFVSTVARVAVYDDMRMAPHVIEIQPAPTADYIEHLATCIDEQKRRLGGKIPYSAIREVSENFIHARFSEVVVSIMDEGNTIRFCDQGPGISNKEKAQLPGFTSAIEPMKRYIRGVGSGLPLVKEYLDLSNGHITIEDNLQSGAVVTISLKSDPAPLPVSAPPRITRVAVPPLSERERLALAAFSNEGALGVKELSDIAGLPVSSTYALMGKLEEHNLIEKTINKKRILTEYGDAVARQIAEEF